MNKKLMLCAIALASLTARNACALEALATGTAITVDYDEPTVNEDNSPLTDLDHTTIHYRVQGTTATVDAVTVPATALVGGGHVNHTYIFPALAGQEMVVDFHATASDGSGNVSLPSNTDTIRIDRLAPAAPR